MHLSLCIRLSGNHGERRSFHPSSPEAFDPETSEEELLGSSRAPELSSWSLPTRLPTQRPAFPFEAVVLLHQPSPDAVADVVVEAREDLTRTGAEAVVITPASKDRIELPKQVKQ